MVTGVMNVKANGNICTDLQELSNSRNV
nr:unnamed protein product [Callosobruchus analis]